MTKYASKPKTVSQNDVLIKPQNPKPPPPPSLPESSFGLSSSSSPPERSLGHADGVDQDNCRMPSEYETRCGLASSAIGEQRSSKRSFCARLPAIQMKSKREDKSSTHSAYLGPSTSRSNPSSSGRAFSLISDSAVSFVQIGITAVTREPSSEEGL